MPSELLAGRYGLLERLGGGRQGEVYRAEDQWESCTVAVKLLGEEVPAEGLLTWAELRHPNIVGLQDVGFGDGRPYLVMEYVRGPGLRETYLSSGEGALLSLVADLCLGLQMAHSRGVCHGDLKPANILVEEGPGGRLRAKLTDFGLWRRSGVKPDGFSGTLAYAAPEVLRGEVPDHRSDLYSLGACLYEVVTGEPVFRGGDLQGLVRAHVEESPADPREVNPAVSEELTGIVLSLLAKEPIRRFSSAGEVFDSLQLQERTVVPGEPAWLGRERELRFFRRTEELASEGKGSLVLVVGEDGVGKTALLERLYLRWGTRGGKRLRLQCGGGGSGGDLAGDLVDRACAVAGVRPEASGSGDPTVRAKRFVDASRGLSDGRPALVVLEDLERADVGFLGFVGALAPMVARERVLITASLNREGLAALGRAIPALSDMPQVRRVRLRPFTREETGRLMASMVCRQDVETCLCDLVHRCSGGNPQLVCETVRYLTAEGHLHRDRGTVTAAEPPEAMVVEADLASVVAARMRALGDTERRVVGALALFGRAASEDVLVELTELDARHVERALGTLETAGIVCRRGGGWSVRNRLLCRAGELMLSEAERVAAHDAAARAVEARWPGDPGWMLPLVRHLARCGRNEDAFDLAMREGGSASSEERYGQALELYAAAERCLTNGDAERWLPLLKGQAHCYRQLSRAREACERIAKALAMAETCGRSHDEVITLRLSLSKSLAGIGQTTEASEHLEEVLSARDLAAEVEADALAAGADIAFAQGRWERSEKLSRRCLAHVRDSKNHELVAGVENRVGAALIMMGKLDEAAAYLERALRLSARSRSTSAARRYATNLGNLCMMLGRHREAEVHLRTALSQAERMGAAGAQASVSNALGLLDVARGALRSACRWFDKAEELARACGNWPLVGLALGNAGLARVRFGEWREGGEMLREALAVGRRKKHDHSVYCACSALGDLHKQKGDLDVAERCYSEAREVAEAHGDLRGLGSVMCALAALRQERGALDEADICFAEGIDALRRSGAQINLMHAQCDLAELRVAQGRFDEADAIVNEAVVQLREPLVPQRVAALRALAKVRASLGMHEDAASAFMECVRLSEAAEGVAQMALTNLEVGRWLASHGEEPGFKTAETYLTQALESFRRMEARLRVEEAERLLGELRERPTAGVSLPVADAEKLASLYRMVAMVNSAESSRGLLERVLDLALHAVGGERGLVILVEPSTGELEVRAKTEVDSATVADAERISRAVVEEVAGRGEPVYSSDALRDARFSDHDSIKLNRIACFMCVPLRLRGEVLGTIYVDSSSLEHRFAEEDVSYLSAFAHQAAIAMENMRLREELEGEVDSLQKRLQQRYAFGKLVGRSESMVEVYRVMEAVSESVVPVLIQGETGTGKELVAEAIHHNGARRGGKFVPVDCGALPETLLESELFGYEKGAFTGAVRSAGGLFQLADGGTIFLDEVGDMSTGLQAKLLRVLQTGEVKRVGKAEAQRVDVRLIAATNKDLAEEVRQGRFREDLYYRLKGVTIDVPPLRERRDDIPLLAAHFLEEYRERLGKSVKTISDDALAYLGSREWRGNVRELERVVEAAVALSRGQVLGAGLLRRVSGESKPRSTAVTHGGEMSIREAQMALEKEYAKEALQASGWNITKAAKRLGLNRRQLQRIMHRHGIDRSPNQASEEHHNHDSGA